MDWRLFTAVSNIAPTSLPAVIDIRDLPELKRKLGLHLVRGYWGPGDPRPTLEVTVAPAGTEAGHERAGDAVPGVPPEPV